MCRKKQVAFEYLEKNQIILALYRWNFMVGEKIMQSFVILMGISQFKSNKLMKKTQAT